jgi:hypothetical protein
MSRRRGNPKMSRHHRVPKSAKGTDHPRNISIVTQSKHRAYHVLFGTMNPKEIADYLTDVWIDPNVELLVRRKL